jgi:hypothetical protein
LIKESNGGQFLEDRGQEAEGRRDKIIQMGIYLFMERPLVPLSEGLLSALYLLPFLLKREREISLVVSIKG